MPNLEDIFGQLEHLDNVVLFDDFLSYTDAQLWTKLAADSGASVASSGDDANGFVALTTGATDNNEAVVATTNEVFLCAASSPIVGVSSIVHTEANSDDANIAFGFTDVFGANTLLDNGAGPKTSGQFYLIYKVDGETSWRVASLNSSSTVAVQSNRTTKSYAAGRKTFRIEIKDYDGSNVQVTYFINGEQCLDYTTLKPIAHLVPLTSATQMRCGVYVKAGGSNSEVVAVDYIGAVQYSSSRRPW